MSILGPLASPSTSAVTETLASLAASVVTVSPSTSKTAGSCTVAPGSSVSRLTLSTSPTATLCWSPPLRTIAYTADPSIGFPRVLRHPPEEESGQHEIVPTHKRTEYPPSDPNRLPGPPQPA